MFGTWDLVRPRYWHPMASLEQSMMDLDYMADQMFRSSRLPFYNEMLATPSTIQDDDDFFNDLPLRSRDNESRDAKPRGEEAPGETQPSPSNDKDNDSNREQGQRDSNREQEQRRAFSTYSFSNSSVVDDKGRRVVSTRRRYEDSTGRLKAIHERQIDDKKVRTVWNRMSKDDAGKHDKICMNGTAEEFEQAWKATPFGEAQEQREKAIKEKGEGGDDREKLPA